MSWLLINICRKVHIYHSRNQRFSFYFVNANDSGFIISVYTQIKSESIFIVFVEKVVGWELFAWKKLKMNFIILKIMNDYFIIRAQNLFSPICKRHILASTKISLIIYLSNKNKIKQSSDNVAPLKGSHREQNFKQNATICCDKQKMEHG